MSAPSTCLFIDLTSRCSMSAELWQKRSLPVLVILQWWGMLLLGRRRWLSQGTLLSMGTPRWQWLSWWTLATNAIPIWVLSWVLFGIDSVKTQRVFFWLFVCWEVSSQRVWVTCSWDVGLLECFSFAVEHAPSQLYINFVLISLAINCHYRRVWRSFQNL